MCREARRYRDPKLRTTHPRTGDSRRLMRERGELRLSCREELIEDRAAPIVSKSPDDAGGGYRFAAKRHRAGCRAWPPVCLLWQTSSRIR